MKLKITFQILILISTLFLTNSGFSQSNKKLELGLGYAIPRIKHFDIDNFNWNISAKYLINKNAIRTGFSYGSYYNKGFTNLSNIGIEHRFLDSKFKLIAGIDLCYMYRTYSNYYDFGVNIKYTSTFQHIGLGPVLGAEYKINNRFSIQTELAAFLGYGYGEIDNKKDVLSTGWGYTSLHRYFSFHVYYTFGKK